MPPLPDPTPTSLAFGAVLRRCRLAEGLTQAELAEIADVHLNTIGLNERGRTVPTLDVLIRLAASLNVSAASMVAEVEAELTPSG